MRHSPFDLHRYTLRLGIFLSLATPLGTVLARPAQQMRLPSGKSGYADLSAKVQKRQGDVYIADGDVDIHYAQTRLRADHAEYNSQTYEATATGHVVFDYENQHLQADEAHYNISAGTGTFRNVRGTVQILRRPNPMVLVSQNPLYFQADEVRRISEEVYLVRKAWITICDPQKPTWQFYASHAKIRLNKTVALVNANFRLYRVPLIWLPYATAPAGSRLRQSGFLMPDVGNSSLKGFLLGDAFYWAPASWMDTTLGSEYMSKRGWSQRADFRATPFESTSLNYSYYGVIDRGLPDANGVLQPQGGHEQSFQMQSLLPDNWRFVADVNQLSSLTFRLAFADAYGDAINSEVRSAVFLANNFRGFSLNFASLNDENFLTINPETRVLLRNLPEAQFGSVEQAPWRRLPIYFAFDSFYGGVHRQDQNLDTPAVVQRSEFAPRVTVPLHLGSWLGITTSAAFRTTRYGASLDSSGALSEQAIIRNTGEFTVDLRPPSLERFYGKAATDKEKRNRRFKHTIEPDITYRYVTGVNDFSRFIRFGSDATLTDTNEVEYGFTQRLYMKTGDDQPVELLSWNIVQKHYFDPTFGGAIVDGQRNVFQALNDITPFAFALGARNWSPIVSDLKLNPGGRYDAEQILEYDPQQDKITAIGTLVKVRPFSEFFATVAHFRLQDDPILQPLSNQIRALLGYGGLDRKGFNAMAGVSYDITNQALQNQIVQVTYNGSCCGLSLEYHRIALGQVRTENQFRVAFIIANIGTFGNLRRQTKIF
ncbi:MAG TPA: LPS assembly protein LptD [Terriglobales bacterium]|nr:LPS assembly protein LptD [Terriglobales bacterium]